MSGWSKGPIGLNADKTDRGLSEFNSPCLANDTGLGDSIAEPNTSVGAEQKRQYPFSGPGFYYLHMMQALELEITQQVSFPFG